MVPSLSKTFNVSNRIMQTKNFLCLVEFKDNLLLQIAGVLTQCYCIRLQWAIGPPEWQSDTENNSFWAKKLTNNFSAWKHLFLSLKWVTINVQGQEVWWITSPNILIFWSDFGKWVNLKIFDMMGKCAFAWKPSVTGLVKEKERMYGQKWKWYFPFSLHCRFGALMVFLCARVSSLKSEVSKLILFSSVSGHFL